MSTASRWTAERVGEAVIKAFRLLPSMPVYAPRRGRLAAVLPGQDIGPLEILALSGTVLGHDAPERRALLFWGRARATSGDVGGSIAAYCRSAGLGESTFNRRRRNACLRIAEAIEQAHSADAVEGWQALEDEHGMVAVSNVAAALP